VATACEAVKPDNCKLVPVAAPISGVTSVGEVDNTTEPVPVALNSVATTFPTHDIDTLMN
jgi:hypothetical protein